MKRERKVNIFIYIFRFFIKNDYLCGVFAKTGCASAMRVGSLACGLHCLLRINSVKVKEIVRALELVAPLPLQEDYDNAGLQVGLTEADVSGALLCLDVTEAIVDEAVAKGCNLIVAHHPLIFRRLAHITGEDYVQRTVRKAIKNDVAILAMHTNLDNANGGVNFKMAEKMRLTEVSFLQPSREVEGVEGASGVIGKLTAPVTANDFLAMLKREFRVSCVQANELLLRPIERVALCGGGGAFLLDEAIRSGADAFVTGEMGYHQFFGHEQQLQIAVIGHYQSEQYTSELLKELLEERFPNLICHLAETNTNPIVYV